MNKINYDFQFNKICEQLRAQNKKAKLLLHSCCAPCSSACLERLKECFDITVYYYNPNIDSEEEYYKRANEQKRLCQDEGVNCIVEDFNSQDFFSAVKGFEDCPERGERCFICYKLRLKKTALFAKENDYDYFCTTLSLSPLKDSCIINQKGKEVQDEVGVNFLFSDFKKRGGYLRSIEISKEKGLYRQNYCGCIFSKREL